MGVVGIRTATENAKEKRLVEDRTAFKGMRDEGIQGRGGEPGRHGPLAGAPESSGLGLTDFGLPELPCEDAKAASESIAFFCWTAFIVFLVFSMTSRFCPEAVPATIPKKRIPVVSFIGSPAS